MAWFKAATGFGLGYGGAAATGTESTFGRVNAGLVGAITSWGGGRIVDGLTNMIPRWFSIGTVGAISTTGAEIGGQAGDYVRLGKEIQPTKIAAAIPIGFALPLVSGEASVAYFAKNAGLKGWSEASSDLMGAGFTTMSSILPSEAVDAKLQANKEKKNR